MGSDARPRYSWFGLRGGTVWQDARWSLANLPPLRNRRPRTRIERAGLRMSVPHPASDDNGQEKGSEVEENDQLRLWLDFHISQGHLRFVEDRDGIAHYQILKSGVFE